MISRASLYVVERLEVGSVTVSNPSTPYKRHQRPAKSPLSDEILTLEIHRKDSIYIAALNLGEIFQNARYLSY
jgi:hypothetical protein